VRTVVDKGNKRRLVRLVVRCGALIVAVIFALPILPWSWTSLVLPALSSYVLIGSALSARVITPATWVGAPVLLMVLVRRRWFCRYGCPVGLLAEYVGRLRSAGKSMIDTLPPIGRWAALITLGGALIGYPLFLWMDPLAIFQGLFTLWGNPLNLAGQVSALALGVILGISLLLPGAWCARLCPLGATQELLVMLQHLFSGKTRPTGSQPIAAKPVLSRRSAFSAMLGAVCAVFGAGWARAALKRSPGGRVNLLRPPGAIDEARFTGLCMRCGNCMRACPAKIIRPSTGDGIAGFLAPTVSFANNYCREDCNACTQVCPSGAIARLSLKEKRAAWMGLAKVEASLCLLYDDRECDVCAKACPYAAIEIVWNEEEYVPLPQVIADKCPGCGACEFFCPGTNDWEREHSEEPIPIRKAIEISP